jgi:hypothetical protein
MFSDFVYRLCPRPRFTGLTRAVHTAIMPPKPVLGFSLLYVQINSVTKFWAHGFVAQIG